ncbi:MAG: hypothetical protein IJR52_10630, partial [Selenomonadaceae bacterium]|nr:hypothetical protein [Selenomonadaceae bacterium]
LKSLLARRFIPSSFKSGFAESFVVLSGLKKNFYLLNLLFFCSPKRKEAKEKGASRGRLLVRGFEG